MAQYTLDSMNHVHACHITYIHHCLAVAIPTRYESDIQQVTAILKFGKIEKTANERNVLSNLTMGFQL